MTEDTTPAEITAYFHKVILKVRRQLDKTK